uniref:Uncharacterized protein n=1 Tax=Rhizophagus irregularis (strain DAOM 181602 / DAOM 197198 / MUCL 43194) TaxID=747089 RepID=U9UKZ6_RHIID
MMNNVNKDVTQKISGQREVKHAQSPDLLVGKISAGVTRRVTLDVESGAVYILLYNRHSGIPLSRSLSICLCKKYVSCMSHMLSKFMRIYCCNMSVLSSAAQNIRGQQDLIMEKKITWEMYSRGILVFVYLMFSHVIDYDVLDK